MNANRYDRRHVLRLLALGAVSIGVPACRGGADAAPAGSGAGGSPPPSTDAAAGDPAPATPAATPIGALAGGAAPIAERILVVVELNGGNDGLATVIPVGDGRYRDLRPQLAVDGSDALPFGEGWALNAGLAPVASRLAALQGVGVARPDLSHFAMLSRWWRGDPEGDAGYDSGFLGRCCDVLAGDEPVTGLSLGFGATPALASQKATTMSLPNLDLLSGFAGDDRPALAVVRQGWRTIASAADAPPAGSLSAPAAAGLAGLARQGLGAALDFADVLAALPEAAGGYPETDIGRQLALAGRLIRGDAGVRVLHLPSGSFDTHDGQRFSHDQQMQDLGAALAAFQRDLDADGYGGRVLVATTSEFGRRVPAELDGTDHGGASVMLLAGPVRAGRHGADPSLADLDEHDNLRATVNLRDYYATLAEGWLGVPAESVLPAGATVIDELLAL